MNLFKQVLALGMFAAASCASAQNDNEKPYLIKSFSADGFRNLKVETSGGNVTVVGQNGGEARIEMYVRGNDWKKQLSEDEIKDRLEDDYEVNINKDASTLTATARRTSNGNGNNGLSISFKVYAPASITSNLRTSGGNIRLSGLSGKQVAETSGGNIHLDNLKGNTNVETSGGNIDINGFNGTMEAETSGGNIRAENAKGNLKLETSGGNIKLASVSGGVDAETSGGNISAELDDLGEFLTLSTSSGNINVKMPMDQGMDLDLEGSKVYVTMKNFNGEVEEDRVKGKLNGGGIPIRIATSGGNVKIN